MTKSEKQTRLDQFEIKEAFGIWPDFNLTQKARRVSAALFRFDCFCAGGAYKSHQFGTVRELSAHIEWKNADGTPAEFREGVPHMMREVLERDPKQPGYLTGGNYRDCGPVRNWDKVAREVVAAFSQWFKDNGRPDVCARFGGDMRYIVIAKTGKECGAGRVYSLID